MPALNQNEKMKCEDYGNMYIRQNAARHQKRCEKQKEHKCSFCDLIAGHIHHPYQLWNEKIDND